MSNYPQPPPEEPSVDPETKAREEARQRALDALKEKWNEPDCPSCGANVWAIGDFVDMPLRNHLRGFMAGSASVEWRQVYVYVPVICQNCGYTHFFHSGALGA